MCRGCSIPGGSGRCLGGDEAGADVRSAGGASGGGGAGVQVRADGRGGRENPRRDGAFPQPGHREAATGGAPGDFPQISVARDGAGVSERVVSGAGDGNLRAGEPGASRGVRELEP